MRIVLLILSLLCASPALAESAPRAGALDPRVRDVLYQKDNVVAVDGSYGVSTMIILGEDEKIETLALGDSVAWKVEPNRKGNIIFLKPVEKDAFSNLNVVTNKRLYAFVLRSGFRSARAQIFKIRFRYPEDDLDARLMSQAKERAKFPNARNFNLANANRDYAIKGSDQVKPLEVFDDGVKTWFRFAETGETPALFIVDKDRNESLVNSRREGPYLVVDKVAPQWTLRNGEEATCLFNLRVVTDDGSTVPIAAPQRIGFDAAKS